MQNWLPFSLIDQKIPGEHKFVFHFLYSKYRNVGSVIFDLSKRF